MRCVPLTPLPPVRLGDLVTRWLAGEIPMRLRVTALTHDRVICEGGWEFDRTTGVEIDDALDVIASYITVDDGDAA